MVSIDVDVPGVGGLHIGLGDGSDSSEGGAAPSGPGGGLPGFPGGGLPGFPGGGPGGPSDFPAGGSAGYPSGGPVQSARPVSPQEYYRVADRRHTLTSMFGVEIEGIDVQSYFRECSSLTISTHFTPQAEGGLNDHTHYLLDQTTIQPITLKRGIIQQFDLFDWYSEVTRGMLIKRPLTIKAYRNRVKNMGSGPDGLFAAPVITWVLLDALPVKWVGPAFNANANAIAVEEITFICDGLMRH